MKIYQKTLNIKTTRRVEFVDITDEINKLVKNCGILNGVCYIFVPHTTAGLTINENADPSVVNDIISTLNKLIPKNADYSHFEGNSDAHIKSSLFGCSIQVFVEDQNLKLGTWQSVYFCEFDGPRHRNVWVKIIGE